MFDNLDSLCIGELSSVFYRQYQAYMNHMMKPYSVNYSECAYLIKIPDNEPVTQSYIANKLFCDNAAVTRSLRTLEKKGLVKQLQSPNDKRAVLVSLTAKGSEAKQLGVQSRKKWKKLVMAGISTAKEKEFLQTLKAMTKIALETTHNKEEDHS